MILIPYNREIIRDGRRGQDLEIGKKGAKRSNKKCTHTVVAVTVCLVLYFKISLRKVAT